MVSHDHEYIYVRVRTTFDAMLCACVYILYSLFLSLFRCGESQRFFYMEVGRHSALGAGELYLETDDPLIAQNMHTTIMK